MGLDQHTDGADGGKSDAGTMKPSYRLALEEISIWIDEANRQIAEINQSAADYVSVYKSVGMGRLENGYELEMEVLCKVPLFFTYLAGSAIYYSTHPSD